MQRFFCTSIYLLAVSFSLSAQSNNLSSEKLNYNGPIDIIGNELTYPFDGVFGIPSPPPTNIGDINGDGFDDLLVGQNIIYLGGSELTLEPFQVMENNILAIGDINGDGFSDAIGSIYTGSDYFGTLYKGSENGLVQTESPGFDEYFASHIKGKRYIANQLTVLTNIDFNSDGYTDILSSYNTSGLRYNVITYGSQNILSQGFSENLQSISNNDNQDFDFFIDFFEQNEKKYFAFESCTNEQVDEFNPFNTVAKVDLKIFELTDADTLKFNTKVRFPYYNSGSTCSISTHNKIRKILIDDINSDQKVDIIFHYQGGVFAQSGLGLIDDTLRFDNPYTDNFLNDSAIDSVSEIHFLGDLNEDNVPEFQILKYGHSDLSIGNFDIEEGSIVWNNSLSLISLDFLPDSYFTSSSNIFEIYNKKYSNYFKTPDIKEKVLSLGTRNTNNFGKHQFKFSSLSSDFFNDYEEKNLISDVKDFSKIIRKELFFLGDIELDGIDNFATWENRYNGDFIVYRNGFYDEAISEFQIPDSLELKTITSGNFIGPTVKSTAHLYTTKTWPPSSYIFFFDTNTSANVPSLILKLEGDLDFLNNIGDVNNDGFDEFGLSSRASGFLIFKGASDLSTTPDFEIDPGQYLNTVGANNTSSSYGITQIQPLGDINNDTFDDFLISDPTRQKMYGSFDDPRTNGSIYLFYGKQDESFDFSIPDFEFLPDSATGSPDDRFGGFNEIAYGDFDGDGLTDFAAKPARHRNPERTEGVGAIQIFYSKNSYRSLPDTTIRIRSEYVTPTNQLGNNEYALELYRSLMKAVDVDDDGNDELLLVSGGGLLNAILYDFDEGASENATSLFTGLYPFPLNPSGRSTAKQYNSLVGDFVGDGGLYFLGYHTATENRFRDTPIMLFDLVNPNPVSNENNLQPENFTLLQNYPNPFNPTTNISFTIPKATTVSLTVYNMLGQKVSTLINERLNSGSHSIKFDASSLASGLYFYTLKTDSYLQTKKMLLIK